MCTRQEMMPHVPKIELKFNNVWMDERIGGGNDTTKKIISRDPYKIKHIFELKWNEKRIDYT